MPYSHSQWATLHVHVAIKPVGPWSAAVVFGKAASMLHVAWGSHARPKGGSLQNEAPHKSSVPPPIHQAFVTHGCNKPTFGQPPTESFNWRAKLTSL